MSMAENMVSKPMAGYTSWLVALQPQIRGFAHLEIRSFGGLFGALYCCYHSSVLSASTKGHERMRRPKSHVRRQYFQCTRRLTGPVFSPWRSRLGDEMRAGRSQITSWNVMEDSYANLHAKELVPVVIKLPCARLQRSPLGRFLCCTIFAGALILVACIRGPKVQCYLKMGYTTFQRISLAPCHNQVKTTQALQESLVSHNPSEPCGPTRGNLGMGFIYWNCLGR
jgi:hypothetical protein